MMAGHIVTIYCRGHRRSERARSAPARRIISEEPMPRTSHPAHSGGGYRGQFRRPVALRRCACEAIEGRVLLAGDPVLVKDINAATQDSLPREFAAVGTSVYFSARDFTASDGEG